MSKELLGFLSDKKKPKARTVFLTRPSCVVYEKAVCNILGVDCIKIDNTLRFVKKETNKKNTNEYVASPTVYEQTKIALTVFSTPKEEMIYMDRAFTIRTESSICFVFETPEYVPPSTVSFSPSTTDDMLLVFLTELRAKAIGIFNNSLDYLEHLEAKRNIRTCLHFRNATKHKHFHIKIITSIAIVTAFNMLMDFEITTQTLKNPDGTYTHPPLAEGNHFLSAFKTLVLPRLLFTVYASMIKLSATHDHVIQNFNQIFQLISRIGKLPVTLQIKHAHLTPISWTRKATNTEEHLPGSLEIEIVNYDPQLEQIFDPSRIYCQNNEWFLLDIDQIISLNFRKDIKEITTQRKPYYGAFIGTRGERRTKHISISRSRISSSITMLTIELENEAHKVSCGSNFVAKEYIDKIMKFCDFKNCAKIPVELGIGETGPEKRIKHLLANEKDIKIDTSPRIFCAEHECKLEEHCSHERILLIRKQHGALNVKTKFIPEAHEAIYPYCFVEYYESFSGFSFYTFEIQREYKYLTRDKIQSYLTEEGLDTLSSIKRMVFEESMSNPATEHGTPNDTVSQYRREIAIISICEILTSNDSLFHKGGEKTEITDILLRLYMC